MSKFALKYLEKHGWKHGDGLGREKQGQPQAIKVKLKANTYGLGANPNKLFANRWWEDTFNSAAGNLAVVKDNENQHVALSTINKDLKYSKKQTYFTEFQKSHTLTGQVASSEGQLSDSSEEDIPLFNGEMKDEDLFAKCGGLTAHRGARHGLTQLGKLARVEQQNMCYNSHMHDKLTQLRRSGAESLDDPMSGGKALRNHKSGKISSHPRVETETLAGLNCEEVSSLGSRKYREKLTSRKRAKKSHDTLITKHCTETDLQIKALSRKKANEMVDVIELEPEKWVRKRRKHEKLNPVGDEPQTVPGRNVIPSKEIKRQRIKSKIIELLGQNDTCTSLDDSGHKKASKKLELKLDKSGIKKKKKRKLDHSNPLT